MAIKDIDSMLTVLKIESRPMAQIEKDVLIYAPAFLMRTFSIREAEFIVVRIERTQSTKVLATHTGVLKT